MRPAFGKKSREIRRKQSTPAWIATPGTFALTPCEILDMSNAGAKLSVPENADLRPPFNLTFSSARRDGRACEVRWRKGSIVGVRFLDVGSL